MASVPHQLHSLLLLFLSLLSTSLNCNSNTTCPSFHCGNGVTISYPFWHHENQLEYCGYPGFGLSCVDPNPILHLSEDVYYVKNINYSENTLILAYAEVKEQSCPRARHNVTLDTSLLQYSQEDKILRFFYNCTLYPPSPPSIDCLRYGSKRSYMFMVERIPEFDWYKFCESIVTVPVFDTAVDRYGVDLKEGFKLKWRSDSTCRSCEATGGFCGYSNGYRSKFHCFCPDGRHILHCRNNGLISAQFRSNFVSIGTLVFGILIITTTILYFIQRRKPSSSQNPIFF